MESLNNTLQFSDAIQQDELFKTVYLNSPLGIAFSSPRGEIIHVNQMFSNLVGYSEKELLEMTYSDITPINVMEDEIAKVRKIISTGEDFYRNEKSFIHKNQSLVWADVSMNVVRDENKKVKYLIAMVTDITEKIAISNDLKKSKEKLHHQNIHLEKLVAKRTKDLDLKNEILENSNKDLQAFAYAVSHDLKEPIRTIGGFTSLFLRRNKDKIDETGMEYLNNIMDGTRRMEKLISSILEYSTIGQVRKGFETVNLDQLISNSIKDLHQLIQDKNAVIEIHSCVPTTLQCIGSQMSIVFHNLISNGLKFNNNEFPKIEILCDESTDFWKFFIKDNGIGIAPEYLNQIFGVFKKLHNRTEYEGSGIGLSLCKKIVLNHGGEIWIESEEGKGSTFIFTIPKIQEDIYQN